MTFAIYVTPIGVGSGLTSVVLGLVRALDRAGIKVRFCKPIAQPSQQDDGPERSTVLAQETMKFAPPTPLSAEFVQNKLTANRYDELLEEVVSVYQQAAQDADVVIVEGLVDRTDAYPVEKLNQMVSRTLSAHIVLVGALGKQSMATLSRRIEIQAQVYGGLGQARILGFILNKVNACDNFRDDLGEQPELTQDDFIKQCSVFAQKKVKLLGFIPWKPSLNALRTEDVATGLQAKIIHAGAMAERRVLRVAVCARILPNACDVLKANHLLITSGDRNDIIIAASMAVESGVPLAGVILTGDYDLDERVLALCNNAFKKGLPVLSVPYNTFEATMRLSTLNTEVPIDDLARIEEVMDYTASGISTDWFAMFANVTHEKRLSPPAFRHYLVKTAQACRKRILLPEGEEPRTIQAAIECQQRQIANCVLFGEREEIVRVAQAQGLTLPDGLSIIEPEAVRDEYIEALCERRKHKGMTEIVAKESLRNNTVLATLMVAMDHADGLVAGALGSTADTIRPALQLIKTNKQANLVSSIFFMCLPEQVLVYGDCAVNPDPDADALADIAIQSARSAQAFGIEPRVAMISYSTGASGQGAAVDKVRLATQKAQALAPDLMIDGPLQYDAAMVENVGKLKAPESRVAGRANVCIFPDLNTGNTTYKAVQRSASVISIGPMLQGLRKPVNDLSRGATVQDIVYTIALTAIQAQQVV